MSRSFTARNTAPHYGGEAGQEAGDRDYRAGCYLTDGVNLYRSLGPIALGSPQMIELEDCRSLCVILVAADELSGGRLRTVLPASADATDAT